MIVPLCTQTLRDRPPCLSPLCVAACQAPPNANLQRPAQRVLPPASASVPCAAAPMLTRGIAAPWGSTTDLARRSTTDQSISTRATSTQVQVAARRQAFKMPSTSFLQVKTVKTVKQEPYAPSSTTAPENSSVYKLFFDCAYCDLWHRFLILTSTEGASPPLPVPSSHVPLSRLRRLALLPSSSLSPGWQAARPVRIGPHFISKPVYEAPDNPLQQKRKNKTSSKPFNYTRRH